MFFYTLTPYLPYGPLKGEFLVKTHVVSNLECSRREREESLENGLQGRLVDDLLHYPKEESVIVGTDDFYSNRQYFNRSGYKLHRCFKRRHWRVPLLNTFTDRAK